jgi:glycosyltransferase involved in cell wall biosynthesis
MKIVHIITRLIIGGAQENTLLSCEGQHGLGHDVTLITGPGIGPEGSLLQRAQSGGYKVIVLDEMRRALRLADTKVFSRLIHIIREINPDVVHTHSSKAGIIGRWAARLAGARCIIHTIHGLAFTASTRSTVNSVYKRLEKFTAPISTRIVCVADAMAQQSLAAGIGKAEQYVTIYSGMETAAFTSPPVPRAEVRKSLWLEDRHVVVGTIARLFDLKGHEDLLQLAPDLCTKFPDLRFLWVGDGTLREGFESQMTAMGLRDRFIITGMVPPQRVPELTGAMDILVHPSRREGLARALPQGALAGIPVVTYDIDGNKEGLLADVSGILLRPFDVSGLGDAITRLAPDPALRMQMGVEGREFAMKRFDANVMVEALDRLYDEVLPRKVD